MWPGWSPSEELFFKKLNEVQGGRDPPGPNKKSHPPEEISIDAVSILKDTPMIILNVQSSQGPITALVDSGSSQNLIHQPSKIFLPRCLVTKMG